MSVPDSQAPDPLRRVRAVVRNCWPLAGLAAIVLGALGFAFRRIEQWGDIGTWVLAVTTLLAFLAAAVAALVAYQLLSVELARDQVAADGRAEQREADQRAQADKIAAWYRSWDNE